MTSHKFGPHPFPLCPALVPWALCTCDTKRLTPLILLFVTSFMIVSIENQEYEVLNTINPLCTMSPWVTITTCNATKGGC